ELKAGITNTRKQPVAQSATGTRRDVNRRYVGVAHLSPTPGGVLLRLSVQRTLVVEHAFRIHAAPKCEALFFETRTPHFNPSNAHHGLMTGPGLAGDIPHLPVPPDGGAGCRCDRCGRRPQQGQAHSRSYPSGTAMVIHRGKDDYSTGPVNAGSRAARGTTSAEPATVGGHNHQGRLATCTPEKAAANCKTCGGMVP